MSEQAVSVRSGGVGDALSALHSCLDALAARDLHHEPVSSLPELLEQLTVLQRRFDAQVLATVEVFESTQAWQRDGATSAAAWMRANLRVTPGAARQAVRTARRLRELPVMEAALREGDISREHVQVVAGAMAATPARRDTIAAAESTFCEAAERLDPGQLAKVVTRWTHTVDPMGALESEQAIHAQRFFSASRTFDGAVSISGLLGPEQGAVVMSALEAVATTDYRETRTANGGDGSADDRSAGQRRADAFVDLCRSYLDVGFAPEIAGVRPHVQLTVPLATLTAPCGQAGHEPGELEGAGPVSGEVARRVSCDALIAAMGIDVTGAPLTYGRSMRTVDPRLRKVLNQRDRGCRFPGCDRPVAWVQAHHIRHWAHGGPTDPDNLVLLCSFHHHRCHEGGFTISGSPEDGTLRFHRPDGTLLAGRRPGAWPARAYGSPRRGRLPP